MHAFKRKAKGSHKDVAHDRNTRGPISSQPAALVGSLSAVYATDNSHCQENMVIQKLCSKLLYLKRMWWGTAPERENWQGNLHLSWSPRIPGSYIRPRFTQYLLQFVPRPLAATVHLQTRVPVYHFDYSTYI